MERADGWAAGLKLAALSLQDADDVDGLIASVTGTDRLISDYLIEEVLRTLDPGLRRFLLRTSVVEWFTPELAEALLGEGGARERIEELDRRSLFLTSLDPSVESYRYHHLFADLLRHRLRLEMRDEVNRVHATAAEWLVENGHLGDAVTQLLAADDHDVAFELIAREGHQWFERGEAATLVAWLSAIVDRSGGLDRVRVDVGMNLLAAQVAADESVAAAVTHRHLLRRADLAGGEQVAAEALHALQVFRELAPMEALRAARRVRATLPDLAEDEVVDFLGLGGRSSVEVRALHAEGWAHFVLGDPRASVDVLRHGLGRPGADYPMWRIYLQGALALVLAWVGQSAEAEALARGAVGVADRLGTTRHDSITTAHLALALTHLDRLECTVAADHLDAAAELNRRRLASFVFLDLHRAIEARLLALTDGPKVALGLLGEPSSWAVEAPVLTDANRAFEAQLRLRSGSIAVARALLAGRHDAATAAARVDVALALRDPVAAREVVEAWDPGPDDVRSTVARLLRLAAVSLAEGRPTQADTALVEAVAVAETASLRWPFLEVPAVLGVLRRGPRVPSVLLGPLLAAHGPSLDLRDRAQDRLIEPLTDRELAVLAELPGRTRNQEIAAALYISVNTVKTHLRSIFRKLDVTDRDEAITRATELGLL